MVTQKQAVEYYLDLYLSRAVYVWGMNAPTIISGENISKAYRDYHSKTYDRTYYDEKLVEGRGRIGSDCSGAHHGISGYDTTAQGYYDRCTKKGKIKKMPLDKICLLFNGTTTKTINHTGVYLPGFGAFHMKNSKENSVLEPVIKSKFKYFGEADFINYNSPDFKLSENYRLWVALLQFELNKNCNANLKIDGEFGPKTLEATNKIGIMKIGSTGTFVSLLQNFLNSCYLDQIEADGDFGKKTDKDVKKFQWENKLNPDGQVGQKTWMAIQKKVR